MMTICNSLALWGLKMPKFFPYQDPLQNAIHPVVDDFCRLIVFFGQNSKADSQVSK